MFNNGNVIFAGCRNASRRTFEASSEASSKSAVESCTNVFLSDVIMSTDVFIGVISAITTLLVIILFFTVVNRRKSANRGDDSAPKNTLVILGSGGHTMEMLKLLSKIDTSKFSLTFAVANTDKLSRLKALEKYPRSRVEVIPRSREVGQSYVTSVWTTLISAVICYKILLKLGRVDLVLCNGPGTCVPLCLGAWFNDRVLNRGNTAIVFVESICRVKSLSLTGKILSRFTDEILVQWPELKQKYPKSKYIARFI